MKTRKWSYGPVTFIFTCDDFEKDGTWLDTKVTINGTFFCIMAGADVDYFIMEFENFYFRYKI